MANARTFGIIESNWGIREYLNQFIDIDERRSFLNNVDQKISTLKEEYDIDLKEAKLEHKEYLFNSQKPEFREKELETKKANFPKRRTEWEKNKSQTDSDLEKYLSMSQQVNNLNFVANKDLRENMLEQIEKSIIFDCNYSQKPKIEDEYDNDEYILWNTNHLWERVNGIVKRYNTNRAKLLREKYQAIELLEKYQAI